MLIIYSEKHQLHDPPTYFNMGRQDPFPETPSRALSVVKAIERRNIGDLIPPTDFGLDPILAIHSQDYYEYLKTSYAQWVKLGGNPVGVIPDTFATNLTTTQKKQRKESTNWFVKPGMFTFDTSAIIVENTFEAAYTGAQVALTACTKLVNDGLSSTFALCRPPGHHSTVDLAGGFCYFNNAAIAAQYMINHFQAKVVVLDVDYHHGNGTQAIFYQKQNPLFVSLHGQDDYPFYWGSKDETGEGEGEGYNINIPLPAGTKDDSYLQELKKVINDHIIPYNPTHVVVSLGVDTYSGDPVGAFDLSTHAFIEIGKLIQTIRKPTVFVMEGGYNVDELGENVCNVLDGFQNV
ncbi:putative acetylpolyamine aminohydrolase [Globomyces pollinis-pini]|nr:putative acetylpolyamine aminohydrolase [Globomyces pollinis-pini]